MTEAPSDVVIYDDDIPDAALEIAGTKLGEGPAGSATLSFCSGYDTCPWERRDRPLRAES